MMLSLFSFLTCLQFASYSFWILLSPLTLSRRVGCDVRITRPEGETFEVVEGETILVECTSEADQKIIWRHHSVDVSKLNDFADRYESWSDAEEESKVKHSLRVTDANSRDSGRIECLNELDLLFDKDDIKIYVVKHEDEKVQLALNEVNPEMAILNGSELHLTCAGWLTSDPRWTVNDQLVNESAQVVLNSMLDKGTRTATLKIFNFDQSSTGRYRCVDLTNKMKPSIYITTCLTTCSGQRRLSMDIRIAIAFAAACLAMNYYHNYACRPPS